MTVRSESTPRTADPASLEVIDARIGELSMKHWIADERVRALRLQHERADRAATRARQKADDLATDIRLISVHRSSLEEQLHALKRQAWELRKQADR